MLKCPGMKFSFDIGKDDDTSSISDDDLSPMGSQCVQPRYKLSPCVKGKNNQSTTQQYSLSKILVIVFIQTIQGPML
jgi:hypothetical protein